MAYCEECGEPIRSRGQQCWETGGACYAERSSASSGPSNSGNVAEYKGRKYRLVWRGKTKYGERAKLQFFDGTKEFWVDAAAIS